MLNKTNKSLFFIISLSLLLACSDDTVPTVKTKIAQHSLPVGIVKQEKLPIFYRAIGTVVSDNRVDITSRVTGFIKEILVKEGQKVEQGQVLLLLDNSDIEGNIQLAKAAKNKAQASLQDALTDFKRYEKLFKSGSVAENSLRKIRLAKEISESGLHEAEAALRIAKSQQQYSRIISPVNGIVVARQKRKGDLATPGSSIITIESDSNLLFESYIPEKQIGKITVGQTVAVNMDALKQTLSTEVLRVVYSGDPISRRYQVKLGLPETSGLLSGMFGYALFPVGFEQSPTIPRSALVIRGGLEGVFVLDEKNHAYFRWLRLGREWPEKIQVRAGLTGGEYIVNMATASLREGDKVNALGLNP